MSQSNIYRKILNFYTILGFTPKTLFHMYLVSACYVLFICLGIAAYAVDIYFEQAVNNYHIILAFVDVFYFVFGALSTFLSFSLRKRFAEVFETSNIIGKLTLYAILRCLLKPGREGTLDCKVYLSKTTVFRNTRYI